MTKSNINIEMAHALDEFIVSGHSFSGRAPLDALFKTSPNVHLATRYKSYQTLGRIMYSYLEAGMDSPCGEWLFRREQMFSPSPPPQKKKKKKKRKRFIVLEPHHI